MVLGVEGDYAQYLGNSCIASIGVAVQHICGGVFACGVAIAPGAPLRRHSPSIRGVHCARLAQSRASGSEPPFFSAPLPAVARGKKGEPALVRHRFLKAHLSAQACSCPCAQQRRQHRAAPRADHRAPLGSRSRSPARRQVRALPSSLSNDNIYTSQPKVAPCNSPARLRRRHHTVGTRARSACPHRKRDHPSPTVTAVHHLCCNAHKIARHALKHSPASRCSPGPRSSRWERVPSAVTGPVRDLENSLSAGDQPGRTAPEASFEATVTARVR